jgi:hypothetical protein
MTVPGMVEVDIIEGILGPDDEWPDYPRHGYRYVAMDVEPDVAPTYDCQGARAMGDPAGRYRPTNIHLVWSIGRDETWKMMMAWVEGSRVLKSGKLGKRRVKIWVMRPDVAGMGIDTMSAEYCRLFREYGPPSWLWPIAE